MADITSLYKTLDSCKDAVGVDPADGLVILDSNRLDEITASGVHIAPLLRLKTPQSVATLFHSIDSWASVGKIIAILRAGYPAYHPVYLFNSGEGAPGNPGKTTLAEIEITGTGNPPEVVLVPPLPAEASFETFEQVVARLRAPNGCPWDREQTHQSLRPHLLEEAYEALEAIDHGNPGELREELGDLLLQIVLHAQIAFEKGDFSMRDVIEGVNTKIIHRHPHVFKDTQLDGVEGVLKNWEKLKENEREVNGVAEEKGLLDGAPKSLPALSLAQEYQDRAARVGFDWKTIDPVLAKMHEELEEVKAAKNDDERSAELGDLLFAVVNLVRWYRTDAESALRGTNQRFARRFKYIEQEARKNGRKLSEMNLEEMDQFWEEAKTLED